MCLGRAPPGGPVCSPTHLSIRHAIAPSPPPVAAEPIRAPETLAISSSSRALRVTLLQTGCMLVAALPWLALLRVGGDSVPRDRWRPLAVGP